MPLESLPLALVAWIMCVVLLAGLIQGALGFGFPFVATPLLAMASDMRTAVIAVLLPTLAVTVINIANTASLRPVLARFWMMPLYALAGSAAGTWLFVAAPGVPYTLLLALITLAYLNLDRLGLGELPLVRRHERAFAPLSGVAAGVFEGTANVAAPPLIIFYLALGLAPAMLVQALNICFLVGKATQFTVLATRGGVTVAEWLATLPLAAIAVGGFFVGLRIRHRIDARTFRIWVKRALFVIALVLLAQFVYGALRTG
jgi:uncharacterized membrane protein YfcA